MAKPATVNRVDEHWKPDLQTSSAAVLDLVHLARQTLGDHALEMELLSLFERQAGQIADQLAKPPAGGDADARADLAHLLKGSSAAVGALALGEAAAAYETALRAGDPGAEALCAQVLDAAAAVRRRIAVLTEAA